MRKFQLKSETPPATTDVVSDSPGLPFPIFNLQPGEPRKITPAEEAALKKLGWTEGQPVAMNLADAMATAKQAAAAAGADIAATVSAAPAITDISQLPSEQQQRLQQSITQMLEREEARKNTPTVPGAPANLQASIQTAQQSVVREAAAYATKQMPVAGTTPATATAAVTPEKAPVATEEQSSNTGLLPTPPEKCPHCGLTTTQQETPLTEEEKTAYLAGILSSAGRYFEKVTLFRGQVTIIFRTPTNYEEQLCSNQIRNDLHADNTLTAVDVEFRMNRYWAAMATASVQLGSQTPQHIPPAKELAGNPVLDVLATIDEILTDALLNRAWVRESTKFYHKLQRLLAAATNPDF